MKKNWLQNKVVVITGANGGLGLGIARILIEKFNCTVYGIARNEEKFIKAKESLGENKDKFLYDTFDVSSLDNWNDYLNNLVKNGIFPDILINNAGMMLPFAKLSNVKVSSIDKILKTNLYSTIYGTKTLIDRLLLSKTPAIINISSSAGNCAVVGQSLYNATKYGVKGFTQALQQEYKGKIYIAGVYPGFIKTDIMSSQNISSKSKTLIDKVSMDVNKASKIIVKKISKRKKFICTGIDGKFMTYFGKLFPNLTASIIRKVLKASKLDLFNEVFY